MRAVSTDTEGILSYKGLNKEILRLSIPSILAGITVPLVGMTDTAVAGRMGTAASLGGIAIGSMMFDWLYWNMSFLRVGTAGMTAQAFGRKDKAATVKVGMQGMVTALAVAVIILLLRRPYARLFSLLVPASAGVWDYALQYFSIRVWAAPAILFLFVIRGWFIGMQNTLAPMIIEFVVNGVNIFLSVFLGIHCRMGVAGIAWGTLLGQYSGLICGLSILALRYASLRKWVVWADIFVWKDLRHFFSINADLFLRSLCMLLIYSGFTALASQYGDVLLAVASIMMNLLLLYSYCIDAFAYSGEALVGRFTGAKESGNLRRTIHLLFIWCAIIGLSSTFVYLFGSKLFLRLLTSQREVMDAAQPFIPWLYVMPLLSCVAFIWDGIYIGITRAAVMRNVMFAAVAVFFATYFGFKNLLGIQALYLAYIAHLVVRSIAFTLDWLYRRRSD